MKAWYFSSADRRLRWLVVLFIIVGFLPACAGVEPLTVLIIDEAGCNLVFKSDRCIYRGVERRIKKEKQDD